MGFRREHSNFHGNAISIAGRPFKYADFHENANLMAETSLLLLSAVENPGIIELVPHFSRGPVSNMG